MIRPTALATKGGLQRLRTALDRWRARGAERIADLVFPPQCSVCSCELLEHSDALLICAACREKLTVGSWPRCLRCGAKTVEQDAPGTGKACPRCRGEKLWFERVFAVGEYESTLRAAVLRMKRPVDESLTLAVGELAFRRYGQLLAAWRPHVVAAIPMHWARRLARGTNSPEILASVLARRLDVPCAERLLIRRRRTKPQGSLTAAQRFSNLRQAFRASKGYDWKGCRVLLVDDILTTGATSREAARVLIQRGAAAVAVAVVARARNPGA